MKNNSKVTVVVPIYNVEHYLKRCLDSIINQTLNDIEIILVDDGSTDNSGIICDEYKKNDNRIIVLHQSNQGLSMARNAGIEIAKSKYICFIDSDDYIKEDMIEYLYNGIERFDADISCCGFSNIYENGNIEKVTIPNEEMEFNTKSALDIHLFSGYIDVVAWNKLYKTKLFDGIRYPKGLLYEDMLTTYKLILKSRKISLHPDSKYFYCKRNSSIGGVKFSEKTLKLIDACNEAVNNSLKKYKDLNNIEIARIQWYIVVLNKMILSDSIDNDLLINIKNKIKKSFFLIIKCKLIPFKRKLQIFLLSFNSKIYSKYYKKFIEKNR